jgi:hypothetical protein
VWQVLCLLYVSLERDHGVSQNMIAAHPLNAHVQIARYDFHFPANASAIPAPDESLLSSAPPELVLGWKHNLAARLLWARRLAHLPSESTGRDLICAALRDAGSISAAKAEPATSCQSRIRISVVVAVGGVMEVVEVCFDVARLGMCLACLR